MTIRDLQGYKIDMAEVERLINETVIALETAATEIHRAQERLSAVITESDNPMQREMNEEIRKAFSPLPAPFDLDDVIFDPENIIHGMDCGIEYFNSAADTITDAKNRLKESRKRFVAETKPLSN